jgi:hypothetical protein
MSSASPTSSPPTPPAGAPDARLDSEASACTAPPPALAAASSGARVASPSAPGDAAATSLATASPAAADGDAAALAPGPRYKRGPGLSFFRGGAPRGPVCQVPGCARRLEGERKYFQRYKICPAHLELPEMVVERQAIRFCQQCGRFQLTTEFDGDRRSCRHKLEQHNKRRRGEAGADGSPRAARPRRAPAANAAGAAPVAARAGGALLAFPARLVDAREAEQRAGAQLQGRARAALGPLLQAAALASAADGRGAFGGQPATAPADALAAAALPWPRAPAVLAPAAAPSPPYSLLAAAAVLQLLAGAPGDAAVAAFALQLVARLAAPAAA